MNGLGKVLPIITCLFDTPDLHSTLKQDFFHSYVIPKLCTSTCFWNVIKYCLSHQHPKNGDDTGNNFEFVHCASKT